jgi:hypothetical protein
MLSPTASAKKIPKQAREARPVNFPPLGEVTRPTVTTEAAAYYLNRSPQTLRMHACYDNGIVRPLRIGGRLAWPVAELKRVLGV